MVINFQLGTRSLPTLGIAGMGSSTKKATAACSPICSDYLSYGHIEDSHTGWGVEDKVNLSSGTRSRMHGMQLVRAVSQFAEDL